MFFFTVFLPKGIQRGTQGFPKSTKSRVKMVSRILSVSLWLPDPSQKGSRGPKGGQKWSEIDDFVKGFLWNFSDRLLWKCFFLAVTELCFDMYSCLLCSSAVDCIVVLFGSFCSMWALLLSSLSLCIPREWNLHCSALSGPFATTGI